MDYKNEICNGCNQPIKEDDDIVVCPICGTPQHRSCWIANGECINSSLHADGFVWQKSQPAETQEQPKAEKTEPNTVPVIGKMPAFDQLAQEAQNLEAIFLKDQLAHKDEEFDGINVTDAGYYLQSGAHRYIRRFRKGRKLSWNWGAFIFAPAWFFYRRLYKFGAIFLAFVVSLNLFSYSFLEKIDIQTQEVYTVIEQYVSEEADSPTSNEKLTPETFSGSFTQRVMAMSIYFTVSAVGRYLAKSVDSLAISKALIANQEFMKNYTAMVKNENIYLVITTLIPAIFAALIADSLVKKKMKEDIEAAKEASDETQMQRSLIISKGGVAPLVFAIVYFANQYLVSILINIGSMVAEWFN